MRIDILTIFPEMFPPVLNQSITGRAIEKGILEIGIFDIRDFTEDKHRRVDDYPFGGGAGMLMTPQPIYSCMEHVMELRKPFTGVRVYMSPKGRVLTNALAKELSKRDLIILCGHYEGVDQRVIDGLIDMEVSIGDYVTTGGELPALVLIDCVSRFVPGVLGSGESAADESFENGFLEYPQYTRPAVFRGMEVPEVLLSGHHANIEKWRREQAEAITAKNRPDLLENGGGAKTGKNE